MKSVQLNEVDRAEITFLVDNYTDLLLPDTDVVKRLRTPPPDAPMAEHGLSCLVSVHADGQTHTILMDAGISGICLSHNAALLASSLAVQAGVVAHHLDDAECVILSHGHFDHFAGLPHFLKQHGRKIPLLVHPSAFSERRIKMGPDFVLPMPRIDEEELTAQGAVLDKRATASTVAEGRILLTGRVERTTSFETGAPYLESNLSGQWRQDPFDDDQAIAFLLKDSGLVVLGGCSHAGIINTVEHVQAVTGIDRVHAVLGGFHLTGAEDDLIDRTVQAMQNIDPKLLVPTHCTGWKAINAFAAAMPRPFVLNSVGTTYMFGRSTNS